MIVALASPGIATTLDEGLGLRGQDFDVVPFDDAAQERTLRTVTQWARMYGLATILGTERLTGGGRQIAAHVIDAGRGW